ncbi:MAG: carbamoylphosphate synthase large subunit [Anaerovibrio sp.]|nr:carbamoylphosphate synthase large subunit [Anaerovibrio sp.]
MNFVFISPHFPRTYWLFANRLKRNGVNVLGIGDCPYDGLQDNVRGSLTEYYYVQDMKDYSQMFRAVAFFSFKYGKIDWLESNNEFWLEQDARLRTDFNITTGEQYGDIRRLKCKSAMKEYYRKAGIASAALHQVSTLAAAQDFISRVGYPVVVKPDVGVNANDTYKLKNEAELKDFFADCPQEPYVMEEFVQGKIFSYDAILDNRSNPLMESCTEWPLSIMDIVTDKLDLAYFVRADIPPALKRAGEAVIRAFDMKSRFVHLEFFQLTETKAGLGRAGDFVGLEVNMRPAGGYTPDMMNFAHSMDVYRIWADMVTDNRRLQRELHDDYFCVYAGRRDQFSYVYSPEEISRRYGNDIVMAERMPEMMVPQMGNQCYIVRLKTEPEVQEFINFVTARR